MQSRVVRHYKKCLYGLYGFADATRTPHGDGNEENASVIKLLGEDATRTPHGDGNIGSSLRDDIADLMQPAPLTGTATFYSQWRGHSPDATRTPHGDGNKQ